MSTIHVYDVYVNKTSVCYLFSFFFIALHFCLIINGKLFVIQTKGSLTIRRLMEANADVDLMNSKGESPRYLAATESSESGII